eukprot:gene11010-1895_t
MKVVVCGAGIGGAATACALHDQGVDVEMYEQASEIKAVGAGIQISPNMTRALFSLGIGEEAVRTFHQPSRTDIVLGLSGET